MTAADFRRIALSLDGVEEYSHAGLPAFRVGSRKFASLASQAQGYGNLMLTLEQQAAFVEELPQIFLPIPGDRKSTRLNSSHVSISYAVFCLKKKKKKSPLPSSHQGCTTFSVWFSTLVSGRVCS